MSFTLASIAVVIWTVTAMADYADLCYLGQLKEYRLDRLRDFFSTKQGKKYLFQPVFLIRFLFLLLFLSGATTFSFVFFGLVIEAFFLGVKVLRKHIRYPTFTLKSVLLIGMGLITEAVMIYTWFQGFFLIIFLRPIVFSLIVFLFSIVTFFAKQYFIKKAEKYLQTFPSVQIIGITGSYGKTTTKTFLSHLLSQKFRVISSPKNINTDIGIARFILQTDFSNVDICIVEMGAYKIGEIKRICDMVHPTIGVLTVINEEHLSLFGSIQNTQHAKYELLRSLPATGLAVVNSDNPYCREFIGELICRVETFGVQKEFFPTTLVNSVEQVGDRLRADLKLAGGRLFFESPLRGEHLVMNIAPCVIVATSLGVTKEEIILGLSTISNPEARLTFYHFGKSILIDDTYNSNPDGFQAAIRLLMSQEPKRAKIVLTRGIIELGSKHEEIHEMLGEKMSNAIDEIALTSSEIEEPIRKGIGESSRTKIVLVYTNEAVINFLREKEKEACVILLENRLSREVEGYLHSRKQLFKN